MSGITNALGAKKTVLSTLAVLAINSAAYAETMTLYTDPATGQVFTQGGEGRQEMGDFVSAKEVYLENQEQDSAIAKADAKKKYPKVENPDSVEFLLGKETGPNMKISAFDNPDMWIKLGVRLQGTFENYQRDYAGAKADSDVWDAYLRRTRFEVAVGFSKTTSFVMDIRDDKVNYQDKGEQTFNVGDAYLQIKKPFDTSLVNFKLYRGKIDVSRTETVKSAYVLHYDRPHVADEAAQYITHNRRGTNAKMYGDWKKKIHYEVAAGDGVYPGSFVDASGNKFSDNTDEKLSQKNFFYGGKVVLSPFDGWEETARTETYFAQGKHFEIGAAYWMSPDIAYTDGTVSQTIDHELINLEMSAHYYGAFVQAEYFKFDGVVKGWGDAETGKSNGWYVTGEYVIEQLGYLAPFVRYEKWDKYEDADGYDLESKIAGVNWYLRGNTTKVGLVYQEDDYGENLSKDGAYTDTRMKLTSQWFF